LKEASRVKKGVVENEAHLTNLDGENGGIPLLDKQWIVKKYNVKLVDDLMGDLGRRRKGVNK
jgi:hypothetical protein